MLIPDSSSAELPTELNADERTAVVRMRQDYRGACMDKKNAPPPTVPGRQRATSAPQGQKALLYLRSLVDHLADGRGP